MSKKMRLASLAAILVLAVVGTALHASEPGAPIGGTHAKADESMTQFQRAELHRKGEGVEKDLEEAAKWYREAGERGNIDAQYTLGYLHFHGTLATKDEKAPPLATRLRMMWFIVKGGLLDYTEAIKWFRMAAEQGHVDAQEYLSLMYAHGLGTGKDLDMAAAWHQKAETGKLRQQQRQALIDSLVKIHDRACRASLENTEERKEKSLARLCNDAADNLVKVGRSQGL